MTSAREELTRHQGRKARERSKSRNHAPHYYPSPATSGVDVDTFMLDLIRSKKLDIDVADSIVSGSITRTMDGASTIEVVVSDHRRVLLESDIWHYTIDVNLDGHFFRLVQIQKSGDDLTLTFEDRIVSYLRSHDDHVKVSRAKMTRAEFIRMLSRKVKKTPIRFHSPELTKRQPIAKGKSEDDRQNNREPGLEKSARIRLTKDNPTHTKSTVTDATAPSVDGIGRGKIITSGKETGGHDIGPYATKKQLDTAERILDCGYHKGANRKCLIVSMMVAIQESKLSNNATSGKYVGVFQQDPQYWPSADGTVEDQANAFFTHLIKADKDHPDFSYTELGTYVQNPQAMNSSYRQEIGQWRKTATQIVDEYGSQGGDTQKLVRKSYQFTVGPPDGRKGENYWEAMLRLAEEVRWRVFVVGNTLYYVADRDLMKSKPRMVISEDTEGIESIDFDYDIHKRNNECTVRCEAGRWQAPQGSVVKIVDCGPVSEDDGRWLVWEITRDLFSLDTTITLKKAQDPKKEPAPEVMSIARTEGDDTVVIGGKVRDMKHVRDRIVAAAYRGLREADRLYYKERRPIPRSMWTNNAPGRCETDCSGFATLVYKAAGAPDPNGFGYNGSGNTGTLMANGVRVAKPEPGDLVFYRSPEHVGIIVGEGYVIEFGGEPGPKKVPIHYRNDMIGYYRFDLHPDEAPDPRLVSSPIKAPTGSRSPANR